MSAVKYLFEIKMVKSQIVPVTPEYPTGLVEESGASFWSRGLSEADVADMTKEAVPVLTALGFSFVKKDEPSDVNGGTKGD